MSISSISIFSRLGNVARQNTDALNIVLDRIKASNSGAIPLSSDQAGIRRASSFQFSAENYQDIFDKLRDAKGVTSYILQTGQTAYDALSEMQRIATVYPTLSLAADQQSAEDSFAIQAGIVENLKASAKYEGILVFRAGTILSVTVDPSGGKLEIEFNLSDIPDVSSVDLTDPAQALIDVNSALNAIHAYIGKAYSYDSQVNGYAEMSGAIITASLAGRASFTDTMAKDLALATQIQVRQQNIAAMVSQANMNAMSAAKIFELRQT